MRAQLENLLRQQPGLKAKEIAKKLGIDKADINSFLYEHQTQFQKDKNFCWSLMPTELKIVLPKNWVDSSQFESAIALGGSPLDAMEREVVIHVPENCRLLLESIARFMALLNQLAFCGKKVTLDFGYKSSAFTYLDRLGFFEYLSKDISVNPERPTESASTIFKDNSERLVEIGKIDPSNPDVTLPKRLKERFVSQVGAKYSQAAFTVLSELFDNVSEHAESPILGFVALQRYDGKIPHIQTVISDSGKGIIGTLSPVLRRKYPEILDEAALAGSSIEELLLKKVFTQGKISQSDNEGKGLGLKSSADAAAKFDVIITVRQENCEAKFFYKKNALRDYKFSNSLTRILGTHICFDFPIDQME